MLVGIRERKEPQRIGGLQGSDRKIAGVVNKYRELRR